MLIEAKWLTVYSSTLTPPSSEPPEGLEVWSPGRLPKRMTVEKLAGEHASLPVNLLLANPVYPAGYIEQTGAGTNDVIERCAEMGLCRSEFRQDEDSTVVMWRKKMVGKGNKGVSRSSKKRGGYYAKE